MAFKSGDPFPSWFDYFDYWTDTEPDWSTCLNQPYGVWAEQNETLKVLSDKSDSDPFFLYLAWQSAHDPDEAPTEYVTAYNDTFDMLDDRPPDSRLTKQAQITVLDEAVGVVVDYLKESGIWDNTLIVFTSDNGADYDRGDNSPLRQYKNSSFEGGIRVPAFVTGGYLDESRRGIYSTFLQDHGDIMWLVSYLKVFVLQFH